MALEQLARQARLLIDKSGEFLGVISQNIVVDYLTGERMILIVAETDFDGDTEEITILVREVDATKASIDTIIADTLAKFSARTG